MTASEFRQQAAEPFHLILDAVGAQRMPIGGGVDRDDRLSEPHFGGGCQPHHRQVGADLHDRVDIVAVELDQRGAQRLRGLLRRSGSMTGIAGTCRARR